MQRRCSVLWTFEHHGQTAHSPNMCRAPANRQMNTALEMAAAAAMSDDPGRNADAAMDSGDHHSHLRL
eukprot:3390525-Lingulodinium_polyedra.AAC.1